MRLTQPLIFLFAFALVSPLARAATLRLELPEAAKVTSAVAVAGAMKIQNTGDIASNIITFDRLLPQTPYDVSPDACRWHHGSGRES